MSDESSATTTPALLPGAIIGFYTILVLVLVYATTRPAASSLPYVLEFLIAVLLLFLARLLSTRYLLDSDRLVAWRLFGSRVVKLDEVRKIEYANLRDLGPVSFIGSWGWRGRMWSPVIGRFDAVNTISAGLLVTVGECPVFISPKDPAGFARELSRRCRSYHDAPLEVDVGAQPAPRVPSF